MVRWHQKIILFHQVLFGKKLSEVKAKYSSGRSVSNKQNNVFVKEFHYGLMSLQLKKSTNKEEDAYFKDFLDNLDNDSSIAEKLGIIKVTFERESANFNNAKTQLSGYKSRQILGIAPMGYAACIIIIIN